MAQKIVHCNRYPYHLRPLYQAYNSHVWAGASKHCLVTQDRMQRKAQLFMGGESVLKILDIPEHQRNVGCVGVYVQVNSGQVFYGD